MSEDSCEDSPPQLHITQSIVGYFPCICGCGVQVLEQTYHATSGLSMECFIAHKTKELREIEIIERGKRMTVKVQDRPREKRYPGQRRNKYIVSRAQVRALARLKLMFPDEFDVLYAEERHRVGLPPVVRHERGYLTAAAAKTNKVHKAYARTVNQGAKDA